MRLSKFKRVFDFKAYRPLVGSMTQAMDEIHIQMLHAAVAIAGEGCVVVEIGSYRGASTTALVEAVNRGRISMLHIIEIKPTVQLRKILDTCQYPERVQVHTEGSWLVPITAADFVFIDGSHEWPAFADTLRALTWAAKVICMHDTCAYPKYPWTWGSTQAGRLLKEMPSREWFEDSKRRRKMATDRGFLVSVEKGLDLTPVREILE